MGLLLLVLSEDVEVLHFHGLVVVGDFLHTFFSLLVLAQLPDQNLVVELQLAHLLAILRHFGGVFESLLQLVDDPVSLFELFLEQTGTFVLLCHIGHRPKVALGLNSRHLH